MLCYYLFLILYYSYNCNMSLLTKFLEHFLSFLLIKFHIKMNYDILRQILTICWEIIIQTILEIMDDSRRTFNALLQWSIT